jgi:hypothetical protein
MPDPLTRRIQQYPSNSPVSQTIQRLLPMLWLSKPLLGKHNANASRLFTLRTRTS